MKTINLLAFFCLLFVVTTGNAQSPPVITIASEDSAWLNKLVLTPATDEALVIKELGKPSRVIEKTAEKRFYYDEFGVVVDFREGRLVAIGVNFNWDGDKNFPEKSYTGKMMIGKTAITRTTNKEDFEKLTAIKFTCPIPNLCATSNKNANVKALAGFENNAVTQVTLMMK